MADLRQALDDIDKVILNALGERARLSRDDRRRQGRGRPARCATRSARRRCWTIDRPTASGSASTRSFVRRIYREILDDSVRRQQDWLQTPAADSRPLVVGFQGTEGAYGHQAARQHFGVEPPAGDVQGLPIVP